MNALTPPTSASVSPSKPTSNRPTWPVLVSLAVVAVTLAAVAAPGLIASGDPLAISPTEAFSPPSLAHPFGTDESGRDILTRVVHGARASVGIGLAATIIGAGIGSVAGFTAGLGPRIADRALARLFEVLFALPTLVLALLFISVLGGGTKSSVLAIGIATIPGYARMLRSRVRGVAASDYVEWAQLDGAGRARVFARHVAPNSLWPLAAAATLGVGQAIIWVSSLGFLGLGTAPPAAEWGAMLNAGRVYLTSAWWMTLFPGLAIVAIASALTVLGRAAGAPRGSRFGAGSRARARRRRSERRSDLGRIDSSGQPVAGRPVAGLALHATTPPVLAVDELRVETAAGTPVVDGVSLTVAPGECLAIVGESGAGKSVLARTLLGLSQESPEWRVTASHLSVAGSDLTHASPRAWRRVRGTGVALVLQDALQSLDPLRTIEAEVGETLAMRGVRGAELRARVVQALEAAGLQGAATRLTQRPHQLSGGMRQRALIAAALIGQPKLLIADEPTTALDPATSLRVQQQLRDIVAGGTAVVLISHDLASVARVADRIAVLERGRIVEHGPTEAVLGAPEHPVTRALVEAIPSGPKLPRSERKSALSDHPQTSPPDHQSELPRPSNAQQCDAAAPRQPVAATTPGAQRPLSIALPDAGRNNPDVLLRLHGATRSFPAPDGREAGMFDVDLVLRRGETLGVVGESGAGKTTLGRVIIGAETLQRGTRELGAEGCHIRLIPQDPLASFDPRWRVERILRASILSEAHASTGTASDHTSSATHNTSSASDRSTSGPRDAETPAELLALVGLDASVLRRYPAQLSGGQRQRVAIARALAADPDMLVCDEAVSALDVTTQQGVLDLLRDLQERRGVAIVFIAHDLAVVRTISDRILVMRDGRIVETGDTETVIAETTEPFTRSLIAASAHGALTA